MEWSFTTESNEVFKAMTCNSEHMICGWTCEGDGAARIPA